MEVVSRTERRSQPALAAGLIVVAIAAVYANAWSAPFVFDDLSSIVENPTIRSLGTAWSPPTGGLSVSGRPLVNVSLALSHALSGENTWGFHALNILIHIFAALALFGVVRRTLLLGPELRTAGERHVSPGMDARSSPTGFAAAVALLWALHPLQTESVTYIIQRAESLVGFFYLFTLYAFIRAATSERAKGWQIVSVVACLLGMASKEVMVTAPLVVLLYDRMFLSGSFRAAWQQRRGPYFAYALTWGLLLWLVLGTGSRGGTAGFGVGLSSWDYLLTQGQAIVRYLGLSFWPHPLVLDYGPYVARGWSATAPFLVIVIVLLAATLIALRRWPVAGFLGAVFFLGLAPTSSFVPVATQTIAEHRMYLPLAAVVVGVVGMIFRGSGRHVWIVVTGLALGLGVTTVMRNSVYRNAYALWTDTVARRPDNFRARYNRALQLMDLGRREEAVAESLEAVRRDPENPDSHYNHGLILLKVGRTMDAIAEHRVALRLKPEFADAHTALGNALMAAGKLPEAMAEFNQALVYRPTAAEAHNNLAGVLTQLGRAPEALPHFAEALRLEPDSAITHSNLGDTLSQMGRTDEALAEIQIALRLKPDLPEAQYALGSALLRAKRPAEARAPLEAAVRLKPDFGQAHLLLGATLLGEGQEAEGLRHFAAALRLSPHSFEVHYNYANTLFRLGRFIDAAEQYRAALQLRPDLVVAHYNLAHALLQADRLAESAQEFETTLKLDPNHLDARFNLGNCLMLAGRPAEAAKQFEEVLRKVPDSVDGHTMLAGALMALNRPADAVSHYEQSLRLKPDDTQIRDRLAEARAAARGSRR